MEVLQFLREMLRLRVQASTMQMYPVPLIQVFTSPFISMHITGTTLCTSCQVEEQPTSSNLPAGQLPSAPLQ